MTFHFPIAATGRGRSAGLVFMGTQRLGNPATSYRRVDLLRLPKAVAIGILLICPFARATPFRTDENDSVRMRAGTIVPLAIARPVKSFVGPTTTFPPRKLVSLTPLARSRHAYESAGLNFIDRLSLLESNDNDNAIGDHGLSRGRYQICEKAWRDVNRIRKAHGLPLHPWKTGAHNPKVSREYAVAYLSLLSHQFRSAYGRSPTERDMLSLWRHGFAGFGRLNHRGTLL